MVVNVGYLVCCGSSDPNTYVCACVCERENASHATELLNLVLRSFLAGL